MATASPRRPTAWQVTMLENLWNWADVAKGAGGSLVAVLGAYWKRDALLIAIDRFSPFKSNRIIKGENWHTVFVQHGRVKTETVTLRSIPYTNRYMGTIEYKKGLDTFHYAFSGSLEEGFFTAAYRSREAGVQDCGTWTLKLNPAGKALIGAYVWQVIDDQIGHDFYQWTTCGFKDLLRTSQSSIHGAGVFAAIELPKGGLLGQFEGGVVPAPTRRSIMILGQHINPPDGAAIGTLNHSCDPNAEFVDGLLVLNRAVGIEDEITVDYRKTESDFYEVFECNCTDCRKGSRTRTIGRKAK